MARQALKIDIECKPTRQFESSFWGLLDNIIVNMIVYRHKVPEFWKEIHVLFVPCLVLFLPCNLDPRHDKA